MLLSINPNSQNSRLLCLTTGLLVITNSCRPSSLFSSPLLNQIFRAWERLLRWWRECYAIYTFFSQFRLSVLWVAMVTTWRSRRAFCFWKEKKAEIRLWCILQVIECELAVVVSDTSGPGQPVCKNTHNMFTLDH